MRKLLLAANNLFWLFAVLLTAAPFAASALLVMAYTFVCHIKALKCRKRWLCRPPMLLLLFCYSVLLLLPHITISYSRDNNWNQRANEAQRIAKGVAACSMQHYQGNVKVKKKKGNQVATTRLYAKQAANSRFRTYLLAFFFF